MLQEYKQRKVSSNKDYVNEFEGRKGQASDVFEEHAHLLPPFASDPFYSQSWKDYVAKLSEALCYFLLDAKETALSHAVPASSRITTLVPAVYAGLSVKWFTRVLLTIFPCIKACSDQEEIPSHLRWLINSVQFHLFLDLTYSFFDCMLLLVAMPFLSMIYFAFTFIGVLRIIWLFNF